MAPTANATDARPAPEPKKIAADLAADFEESDSQEFWVKLTARADLSAARGIDDWDARGTEVARTLQAFAAETQAPVRALLDERGADYSSYWISNAIRVHGGSAALALELSALPAVGSIFGPVAYVSPEPIAGNEQATINAIEWGIANINADDVWDQYGVRGEGITVANVDTGVQFDHPALVEQYRGNNGDGTFTHDYNWHDWAGGSAPPSDANGHGTHTMGTMVGDDGGENQIGVAPEANWIASNGCCPSDQALLDGMEWMLEPLDLEGENPDASKRPHIVNNSWGTVVPSDDPFGEDIQLGWAASGIFGMWSNGNSGPSCQTSGSPGSRIINYSVGAYDIGNEIASFSARGTGQDGEIKPNIAAPGVDVRSSFPGNSYGAISGTSMAAPHTAGSVALLWSAAPSLLGDIEGTRDLLDSTAIDTEDLQCGGTAEDNNVWGEGRLDALALVDAAPTEDTGVLTGTVTDAGSGDPIAGATVTVSPEDRETETDENGQYSFNLVAGTYDVTVTAFGYVEATQSVDVVVDETATLDFALEEGETYVLTGRVRLKETGERLPGATVHIEGTPLTQVTNHTGRYRFTDVPVGTYDVTASYGECLIPRTKQVVIDGVWPDRPVFRGDERKRFRLQAETDAFGHTCLEEESSYTEAETLLPLTGDDASVPAPLPFSFSFYGNSYDTAYVATNGYLNFLGADSVFTNVELPNPGVPNATIAPFWDDLIIDVDSAVYTATGSDDGGQWFTVEWRNATFFPSGSPERVDVSVTMHESGEIVTNYRNLDPESSLELGSSATIGIENADGTDALQYSYNEATVSDAWAIRFTPPAAAQ